MGEKTLNKKNMPMIVRAIPLEGHRLNIEFASGSALLLCMQNRLHTTRYYALNEPQVFYSAASDGWKISFSKKPIVEKVEKLEVEIFAREAVHMALHPPEGQKPILNAQPLPQHEVWLELAGGSTLLLNLKNRLYRDPYTVLQDKALLRAVTTDGENLYFNDALQIDLDELENLLLTDPPHGKAGEEREE